MFLFYVILGYKLKPCYDACIVARLHPAVRLATLPRCSFPLSKHCCTTTPRRAPCYFTPLFSPPLPFSIIRLSVTTID